MNEIKCPHCGEVFKVDASGYADIVKQVSWALSAAASLACSSELELAQAKRASDDLIRYKDEEIERLKDMKVRLSTKMSQSRSCGRNHS